jgi:hypothetical protein
MQDSLGASGGSLDITTEKGRAAEAAVDALALAAAAAAQAQYDAAVQAGRQATAVQEANDTYQRYIDQLRDILRQAGLSEDAVDALISQIAKMPAYKQTTLQINVLWNPLNGLNVGPGGVGVMKRWGGIEHAATGRVMQAGVVSSPTVLFGERATEKEAFVPKRGSYGRSMGILQEAAGWYGADVVPRGGWASSGGGTTLEVRARWEGSPDGPIARAIQDGLRFDVVQVGGGSVQRHYGRRGRL